MRRENPRFVCRLTVLAAGLGLALDTGTPVAGATPVLPSGASVASGSVKIAAPSETSTLIVQSSQKAIINWQSFSIGAASSVTFQQPNAAAIILNRITGPGSSAIDGNLFANGQVWLVNGNGILFGQGSHIDIGGLIATTSDIRDADFLAGRYDFGVASGNPNASITNRGSIKTATGGSAVLSAARVANEGVIEANLGHVVLGGADAFSVDFDGDNLLRYSITTPVSETPKGADGKPAPDLVSNSGTIAAQGGKILLTARAARNVVNNVINSTGIIEATTASVQNGEIVLDAGEDGAVSVAGNVDVSGKSAGQTGGTISLRGDTVTVADGARLDASGVAGGGTVLIGGNLHGAGPEPNANTVRVGESVVTADATGNGNGGTVAIYSAGETSFAGSVSAKGGANSGNGGTVETSGHDLQIADSAHVNTSAAVGVTGSWLLDPTSIDITATVASKITGALATNNVSLQATGGITVDAPVTYVSANSLSLLAQQNVVFNAGVQNSGAGAILAAAGGNLTLSSGVSVQTGGSGDALILAAAGNFINQAGGAALSVTGGGRWLVFLNAPANNSNGALSASPFYNRTFNFTTDSYAAIAATGNRFVYALAPTLTVTADDKSRTYGAANPAFTATITGLLPGDTLSAAVSGAPSLSTTATTASNVGSYSIAAALGTLVSDFNYGFQFATGTLHIDPATLTYTANAAERLYGAANPAFTGSVGGFVNGESQASATTGTLAFSSPATPTSNVGLYAINGSGLTANNGNYVFAQAAANATALTIDPATLTAGLTGIVEKVYDGTNAAVLASGNYVLAGVVSSDSVTLNNPTSGLYDSQNAGTGKIVSVSGLALSGAGRGNYVLASPNISGAIGIVDAASLTASLTGTVQKSYDGTTAATLTAANYNLTGVISGDSATLNNPTSGVYDSKDSGTGKIVSVSGLAILGADRNNYVLISSSVSGAVGVITNPLVDNGVVADLIGRPFTNTVVPPIVTIDLGAQNLSDATFATTSDTDEDSALVNTVSETLGKSLSGIPGSVQSSTTVLIEGLLRQFSPPPGGLTPHGVPPFGQVYSSWGNEAFWQ